MKKMNYLLGALLLVFSIGCSDTESAEELSTINYTSKISKEENETQEVFELDLRQYYILSQIGKFEQEKRSLEEKIEAGNTKLLPEMEALVNELQSTYEILDKILDITCVKLKIRQAFLLNEIENTKEEYDDEIQYELLSIGVKLLSCGKDSREYVSDLSVGSDFIYMIALGLGSRCNPAAEFKCKNLMNEGKLLINLEEELAKRTQIRFKNDNGEEISNGRIVGNHEEFEGMVQIELEIKKTENGILEISTEKETIEVAIEVF